MKMLTVLVAGTLALAACSASSGDSQAAVDTLTRAQKDSIVATLPIPGASGVGAALRARDAANTRTLAHDTISR
jgi:hypothetical protein